MQSEGEGSTLDRCANCGVAAVDGIKLKDCSACHLVRYCCIKCQKEHRPKHKKECKQRAAELRDELLFKQPECSNYGDCPICCLPMELDPKLSTLRSCCGQLLCVGCSQAGMMQEILGRGQYDCKCPFCREINPKSSKEIDMRLMKRAESSDPISLVEIGKRYYGKGDYAKAFQSWTKAAALGSAESHYSLSILYGKGHGVEKDKKNEMFHLEEAAIGGHPLARYNLGCLEKERRRHDRAVKHWIIAANLGHDTSLDALKKVYRVGLVSKEDFASALRGHQAAVDAMKCPRREAGALLAQWGEDRKKDKNARLSESQCLMVCRAFSTPSSTL